MPEPKNNKVKFGLKNVHYAPLTIDEDGTYSFSTPIRIPGAVNMSIDPNGEQNIFYADDIAYYVSNGNNGYAGDLEMALVPDGFRAYALGETIDSNGMIAENSGSEVGLFALLFEFNGDQRATRHVLYNCAASRPALSGKTTEGNGNPDTETIHISSLPLPDGLVKNKTTANSDATAYEDWYDAVYTPVD